MSSILGIYHETTSRYWLPPMSKTTLFRPSKLACWYRAFMSGAFPVSLFHFLIPRTQRLFSIGVPSLPKLAELFHRYDSHGMNLMFSVCCIKETVRFIAEESTSCRKLKVEMKTRSHYPMRVSFFLPSRALRNNSQAVSI